MEDSISRQSVLNILLYFNAPRQLEMIKKLPSTQTDLILKIQNGIKATDADDVYSCGMRNGMRWCISLIDDKEPLYENCQSAQPEIIQCQDCKYASPNGKYGCKAYHFKLYETHEMKADDFCSRAERRNDE